jgi:outer membrane receptor for ferrienterochelin and colicins
MEEALLALLLLKPNLLNSKIHSQKKPVLYRICCFLKLPFLFFILFFFSSAFAQSTSVILKDKVTGQPVEFARVLAKNLYDRSEKSILSNVKGEVEITISPPLMVVISGLSYKILTDTITKQGHYTLLLSPEYYQLDNVVVTGQFRPQTIDKSIYEINVIDGKKMQLIAANNMGDLLKTNLSFQYRPEGVLGDFLKIRGLTGEHIKVLIDGMPVTGRIYDRLDFGQLTTNGIDHIEVIEGPMSVVYGSNALAGAINIITTDYSNKELSAQANAYYETIGKYNCDAIFSKRILNSTLSISAGRNFFSGWGPIEGSRVKTWKPKLQYIAGGSYLYKKDQLNAGYNTDLLHEELRDLGSVAYNGLSIDNYNFTTRWNNRFDLFNVYNDNLVVTLQTGYSFYRKQIATYENDLVKLEKKIIAHDTTTFHLVSSRGLLSNMPGKKFEYQTGLDYSYELANGKRIQGTKEIMDVAGFMSIIYRPITVLSLQPGVRFIYNSKYKAPVVYALNVKYNPGTFIFRASYGKGFRSPSLKQLYLQFIDSNHEIYGNENLKAETGNNISLAGEYSLSGGKNSVKLDVHIFYNALNNAIQLAVNTLKPGWGMYFNVEGNQYKTKGVEAAITYHFFPRVTLNAGIISTGISRLDRPDKFEYSTDVASSFIYSSPKYKYELSFDYKHTDAYLEFAGNFNSDLKLIGIAQRYITGYHTMDMTLSKSIFKEKLMVSAGIKNLFDVKMVDSYGSLSIHGGTNNSTPAGYGRSYFVKLSFQFDEL